MEKMFLGKSYIKCGGEAIPRLFYKKNKIEQISGSIVLNIKGLFLLYVRVKVY